MTMRPATGSNTPQTSESAGVSGSEAAEEEEEVEEIAADGARLSVRGS